MSAAPNETQAERVTEALAAEADELISHYPVSKRSASIPLLHLWQNHFGHIDESGIEWIAERLGLEPINIYELVTFYPWFRQAAPGRTIIRVCRTLSCALAGSGEVHDKFCEAVGIDAKEARNHHGPGLPVSPDERFSIEFVECLASCGSAPVCLVNDELVERITPEDVPRIIEEFAPDAPETDNKHRP